MLITCSYDLEDGRLMVVCRRLRDGKPRRRLPGCLQHNPNGKNSSFLRAMREKSCFLV